MGNYLASSLLCISLWWYKAQAPWLPDEPSAVVRVCQTCHFQIALSYLFLTAAMKVLLCGTQSSVHIPQTDTREHCCPCHLGSVTC